MVRWKFIAYNPQSLKRADRERRIIHALRSNDVIAMSGTRLPDGDIEVSHRRVETHTVYSWGYGKGRLTNSHAGVQLCLKRSRFTADNVVQLSSPPSELQGRGGALRVKRRDSDFAFIVCYFHPNSNLPYPKRVNSALWKWIDSVVNALPARCVPCLLGDFNARVGKEHVADNIWTTTDDASIGPCNAANENWNGEQFRGFLQKHYLAAVNTYHNAGPTYFGIVADYTSRVDYICVPSSLLSQVQHCCVWHRATIYSWWLLRAAGITGPCKSNLSTPWACSQPPPFKDSPHRAGIWTSSCKAFCGDIVVIIWWRQLSLSANSSWKAPNGSMSNQQVRQMVRGQCYEMRSYLLAESYTRPPPSQCKSGKLTQEPLWSTSTTANCRFSAYLVRAFFGVKVLIGTLCHSRLCRICYADGMLWRDTAKLNGWPRGSQRETSDNENANKCSNFMQVGLVPISGLCGEPPARSQAGIWGQNSAGLIDPGVADPACSNGDFTWQKWVMKVAVKQLPLPGQHTCNSMLVALLAGNSGTVLTRSGVHGCISWLPLTCAEWLRRCGMQKHARQYHAGRFQMKSGACCCTRTTTWHNLGQALGTSIPHYERRNCSKRCSSSSCTCVAQSQHLWNGTARKVLSWTSEMENICVKASGWLTCWTPWASISTARYGDGGNRKLRGTTHLDMLDTEVARKPFCNSVVWGTGYAKLVLVMLRSTRMWRMHSTLPCITNWTSLHIPASCRRAHLAFYWEWCSPGR